ncbi:MAG: CPBP family intramembrane metalloprotease [Bacteroidota bacterium]|nr:CPBP family intramembrane metalloprotease [Bacteroidota bacterium]
MNNPAKNSAVGLLIFFFIVLTGMFIFQGILILVFSLYGNTLSSIIENPEMLTKNLTNKGLLITQLLSHVFVLILPSVIYLRIWKSQEWTIQKNRFYTRALNLSILFFLFSMPIVAYTAWLNQQIELPQWMSSKEGQLAELINKMLLFHTFSDFILAFLTIAIIPAISEELVFRGIIQNQLHTIFKSKWTAILISSLLFSTIHFQFEGFLPRFILGFSLAFIYMSTGNLWYSILLHLANNGIQVIAVYINGPEIITAANELDQPTLPWYLPLIAAVFLVWIGKYLWNLNHENYSNA